MIKKLLIPFLFFTAQFFIAWYGWFSGKLATKGTYLGVAYDSILIRSIVTQLEYLWILIIINVLFSLGFHYGFGEYKNFLVISLIWIASGPLASLLFNMLFVKEKLDLPLIVGIILIALGSLAVVTHQEINKLLA